MDHVKLDFFVGDPWFLFPVALGVNAQPLRHILLQIKNLAAVPQAGRRICFRKLLSNADAGTKRRRRLICRAIRPAV